MMYTISFWWYCSFSSSLGERYSHTSPMQLPQNRCCGLGILTDNMPCDKRGFTMRKGNLVYWIKFSLYSTTYYLWEFPTFSVGFCESQGTAVGRGRQGRSACTRSALTLQFVEEPRTFQEIYIWWLEGGALTSFLEVMSYVRHTQLLAQKNFLVFPLNISLAITQNSFEKFSLKNICHIRQGTDT